MVVASQGHDVTGSWHNSGYHGHYRSRVRTDFMNEYRQRAKPQPPQKYIDRSRATARKHAFSTHDNRERYKDNALYFVDGNGRRQVHASTMNYKPEFIAWMPHKAELIDMRQPLTSVYRDNFNKGVGKTPSPYQQLYSDRVSAQAPFIRTKFDSKDPQAVFSDGYPTDKKNHFTTTYKKIHCTTDPRQSEAKEINTICYQSANAQKLERARSVSSVGGRESVATCMSWSRPKTTLPDRETVERRRLSRTGLEATPLIPPAAQNLPATKPSVQNTAQINNTQPAATMLC